nr:ribonuclease H-like domain-containing protein [Tanacetum cinerariifolium]
MPYESCRLATWFGGVPVTKENMKGCTQFDYIVSLLGTLDYFVVLYTGSMVDASDNDYNGTSGMARFIGAGNTKALNNSFCLSNCIIPNGFLAMTLGDPTWNIDTGDLYPVTKPSHIPSAFLSVSPTTWHQRLGHPALKGVIRYVCGTLDFGIQLYASITGPLVAYTDADWTGCPITRRSTSGYCVFLGDSLLSWSAKWQQTLSRSSAEADYRGVDNVVAETAWLRNLLRELRTPLLSATLVYCDNVSAMYMTANPVQHQ